MSDPIWHASVPDPAPQPSPDTTIQTIPGPLPGPSQPQPPSPPSGCTTTVSILNPTATYTLSDCNSLTQLLTTTFTFRSASTDQPAWTCKAYGPGEMSAVSAVTDAVDSSAVLTGLRSKLAVVGTAAQSWSSCSDRLLAESSCIAFISSSFKMADYGFCKQ